MQLRYLAPPSKPKEAIESRRNPCYGFTVVADIQEQKNLVRLLEKTRDHVLLIIDPDRAIKQHPIHSPLYIKQKFFHAAVFGMQPLLDREQFISICNDENNLLSEHNIIKMVDTLHEHLQNKMPYLEPVGFEIMNDGTILARFLCKTVDDNDSPLLTLASLLDPEKKFSKWDSSNRLRYTTVTVALCVIDKEKINDKLSLIQQQLEQASVKLQRLNNADINQFHVINFDKRTLSMKHISLYATITKESINSVHRIK